MSDATTAKPEHLKVSQMVTSALTDLREPRGTSLQAIKKYIETKYNEDPAKLAPRIRKYLKSAVDSGSLLQTKGKGASGSFKLPSKPVKKVKKPTASESNAKKSKPEEKSKKVKKDGSGGGKIGVVEEANEDKEDLQEENHKKKLTGKGKVAASKETKQTKLPKPKKAEGEKTKTKKVRETEMSEDVKNNNEDE